MRAVQERHAELARDVPTGRLARDERGRHRRRVPGVFTDGAPYVNPDRVSRRHERNGTAVDVTGPRVRPDRPHRGLKLVDDDVEGLGAKPANAHGDEPCERPRG